MEALATVDAVAARIGEEITEDQDVKLANSVLAEASEWARFYGDPTWGPSTAPALAVTIVVAAAARGYLNPSGYDMERGDMVTFGRADAYASGAALTTGEIAVLKTLARAAGLRSVGLCNTDIPVPRSRPTAVWRGYAPVDWGGNKPFPLGWGLY